MLWVGVILIIYLSIFQLLLVSRVGILSFVGLFVPSIIYEAYLAKRLLQGLLLVVIFLCGFFILGMNTQMVKDKFDALLNQNIHKYNEPFRVNRRFAQWESAMQVFMASPVFGAGTGDMQDELQKAYLKRGFNEGYENKYNPHNLFLDSAASLGILGLMSNLVLFAVSFHAAIKSRNLLYLQFLILFILISLVESTFSVQKGVAFFFFFNTIFYSQFSCDKQP
jgi:O-antigen ligase